MAIASWSPSVSAQDLVSDLRTIASRIQAMLGAARRAHDAPRIACLDDTLSRAHAAVAEARTARGARIRRAIRERGRQITVDADRCLNIEPAPTGTVREVLVDPSIPNVDPTMAPEGVLWPDRPPSASGFY